MSQWTHVNGSIRVDWIRGIMAALTRKDFELMLGKPWSFGEHGRGYDDTKSAPSGSEGSIQWSVIENPEQSALAAYTISIWGDLRDYDDVVALEAWFKWAIEEFRVDRPNAEGEMTQLPPIIRSAILEIDVEGGDTTVLLGEYKNLAKSAVHWKRVQIVNEAFETL